MTSAKYIGMDVHKESISIAVVNSVGKTPFFQTSKVMEAILRASVRRAIEGFTPRARQAS